MVRNFSSSDQVSSLQVGEGGELSLDDVMTGFSQSEYFVPKKLGENIIVFVKRWGYTYTKRKFQVHPSSIRIRPT